MKIANYSNARLAARVEHNCKFINIRKVGKLLKCREPRFRNGIINVEKLLIAKFY